MVLWLGTCISKYRELKFNVFQSHNNDLGTPIFNNFFLYFIDETYQTKPVYQRLKQENPEIVEKARETLLKSQHKRFTPDWIDEVAPILYEAYKIMKNYKIGKKRVANYPDLFA